MDFQKLIEDYIRENKGTLRNFEDCSSCFTWKVGDSFCVCGLKKVYVIAKVLDDRTIDIYAEDRDKHVIRNRNW